MLHFYASLYAILIQELERVSSALQPYQNEMHGAINLPPDLCATLSKHIGALNGPVSTLPISRSTKVNYERLRDDLAHTPMSVSVLRTRVTALQNDIMIDLAPHTFLLIEEGKAEFYEQRDPPFGKDVADAFPVANYDIAAASRCIALDEWTAAVFHLMRVHELALRHIGKTLKITVAKTIDFQDWQVIIDGIQGLAKTSPTGKRQGARAARKREFYNEIALYLSHVKEVWRIPVMHARAKFDEREAMIIWENTKALMYRLAVRKA